MAYQTRFIDFIKEIKEEQINFYEYDLIVLNNKWNCEKKKIKEIARIETNKWLSLKRFGGNLVLILIDTIFSLRNNYERMLRNILIPFYQKFSKFKLQDFEKMNYNELISFSSKNYLNLESLHPFSDYNRWKLFKTFVYFLINNFDGEIDRIHNWAINLDIRDFLKNKSNKYDFKGFGIAGIQYLRMQLGVNTIKPEIRIKNSLKFFNIQFKNDFDVIKKLDDFSQILNLKLMELGFILWYSYPISKLKFHSGK